MRTWHEVTFTIITDEDADTLRATVNALVENVNDYIQQETDTLGVSVEHLYAKIDEVSGSEDIENNDETRRTLQWYVAGRSKS